jgi:5-methylcytosine-specific restriction enzyme subunit McrC
MGFAVVDKLITIFERQTATYEELGLTANDPLLEALDNLNRSSGSELIRIERGGLRAKQFVGVIQVGKHTIQILPKIDFDPQANTNVFVGSASYERAATSAAQNFLYLLTFARGIKLHNQSLATLSTNRGAWLEMLTRLFATELTIQLQLGFHQEYVRREDMLPYIRGRWNIARQFSRQPNLVQGLDVVYDDYLPDTTLNRVFRLAVDSLRRITHENQNHQLLTDLETWLQPVRLLGQISQADLNQVTFTRLNERFYPAFQLARLFLEGLSVQLFAGRQRAFAFVFDMDRLFEQFVMGFLRTYSKRILPEDWRDLPIEAQGGMPMRHMIQPPNPSEKPMFHLKPDILLGSSGQRRLIIDTKNKALPLQKPYRGVAEDDAYQMLAYATRFHCPNILLLYPHTFGAEVFSAKSLGVEQTSIRFFVATFNLHQPLNQILPLIHQFRNILYTVFVQIDSPLEAAWLA